MTLAALRHILKSSFSEILFQIGWLDRKLEEIFEWLSLVKHRWDDFVDVNWSCGTSYQYASSERFSYSLNVLWTLIVYICSLIFPKAISGCLGVIKAGHHHQ